MKKNDIDNDFEVITEDEVEIISPEEFLKFEEKKDEKFYDNLDEMFSDSPKVTKPIKKNVEEILAKLEKMLYTMPSFINAVKSAVPETTYRAILSKDQKKKIAEGTIKLMTRKDGTLKANLIDSKTKKIVAGISMEEVNLTPKFSEQMASLTTQMQMKEIAEQIQNVQLAIEEVKQGQENDRLALAYSCQQKLLQAYTIRNPKLKANALLGIVSDAEDSRNLLIQSQKVDVDYIKNIPETTFGKLVSNVKKGDIDARINEVRESLSAVNMVSLVEAMAYQELGETEAAQISLQYYSEHIRKTYLETEKLSQRLDMLDPSPENYWSTTLPKIEKNIQALPFVKEQNLLEEN